VPSVGLFNSIMTV